MPVRDNWISLKDCAAALQVDPRTAGKLLRSAGVPTIGGNGTRVLYSAGGVKAIAKGRLPRPDAPRKGVAR